MISPMSTTAGIGLDWFAPARLVLTVPSAHAFRGQLCPQFDERYGGSPVRTVSPITAARQRQGTGDRSTLKINKFDFLYHPGSTVWRPPV